MIYFKQRGDFTLTYKYFERLKEVVKLGDLNKYGRMGVRALEKATPVDSGLAAGSWYYKIDHDKESDTITWLNSDIEGGLNVAILVQYGHATKNGGYVQGNDFINPALEKVFQDIADEISKEVRRL